MASADITLENGETSTIPFALLKADGTAYDLTGVRVTFAIAERNGGARLLKKLSTTITQISLDSPNTLGTGNVFILPADYAFLPPGIYRYSIWGDLNGAETHFLNGSLTVVDVVART